jgi:3-methyladenine DNA glycosylase AlkD
MATKTKRPRARATTAKPRGAGAARPGAGRAGADRPIAEEVDAIVATLKGLATRATLDGMARYGIPSDNAFGVPVGTMRKLAKGLRTADAERNHRLAAGLWETGSYEARTVAAFVDEAALVTPAQMDRWCGDFDNWAICDTVCFHLFDHTPHALAKVGQWSRRQDEFVRRAAFALLACVALHDKAIPDSPFARCLPLVEKAAADDRNFVKKAVSWALRAIGRRNANLHAPALAVAERLAASAEAAPRWVGKDALRELTSPAVKRRIATGGATSQQ